MMLFTLPLRPDCWAFTIRKLFATRFYGVLMILVTTVAAPVVLAIEPQDEDFFAAENHQAFEITGSGISVSQNVVVVLDNSGSMKEPMRSNRSIRKLQAARDALKQVLAKLPDDSRVGIYLLNKVPQVGHWAVPLGPLDQRKIDQQLNRIRAKGATPLGAAIRSAANGLLAARQKQVVGTYRMLIVTDGEAGDANLVDMFAPIAMGRGITLDVIGVDMRSDHSLATRVNSYRRADDPDSLKRAIDEVFAETSGVDDSGESDYELLGGMDDDVALAVLETLTTVDNSPLGQTRPRPDDGAQNNAAQNNGGAQTPSPFGNPTPGKPTTAPSSNGGIAIGFLCCSGFVVMLFLGVLSALKSLVKS